MTRARLLPLVLLVAVLAASMLLVACGGGGGDAATGAAAERPVIAVTTPILGAVVADAVGDAAEVSVVMPNGADPHDWRPSARDVATLQDADLIVENGLDLEQGLTEAVQRAREDGVPVFTATDHVRVRHVQEGGAVDAHGHAGHGDEGAADPHFWTDPAQMRAVVLALPAAVKTATGADVTASARRQAAALAALDRRLATQARAVPERARTLVTGHESLGYLADRYGLEVVGAVTPSLSSQGQVSAAHLAELSRAMRAAGTRVVFAEAGTPEQVAKAVSGETGATLVELPSHALPADGRYSTFLEETMRRIASALSQTGGN